MNNEQQSICGLLMNVLEGNAPQPPPPPQVLKKNPEMREIETIISSSISIETAEGKKGENFLVPGYVERELAKRVEANIHSVIIGKTSRKSHVNLAN